MDQLKKDHEVKVQNLEKEIESIKLMYEKCKEELLE